ncbi:hypothetical protein [Streptomyces atratus]|uniref:hypothetical protein n=1 Tax=Streptomyces atratus TaxID=1893 RepID=UPI0022555237|nr:hypothetical protein [Streptomyces atratus]MCX5340161.1 hypothetical protein [Streptomyces atratus]
MSGPVGLAELELLDLVGDEPPLVLTGGSGDWTVEEGTGRPALTLNADYPPGAYKRLDNGRHVPHHGA